MKKQILMVVMLACLTSLFAQGAEETKNEHHSCCSKSADSLVILWTSGDAEVFSKVIFLYALNSKTNGWWEDVELLIWGPSSKLLAETSELQDKVTKMKNEGVVLTACKWCADQYGVSAKLEELGAEVKYMGKPLTDYIKSGRKVIVF